MQTPNILNHLKQHYAKYLAPGIFLLAVFAPKIYESSQPKKHIDNAVITSITPYYRSGGDIPVYTNGYRVYIEGVDKPIDFPKKNWDDTVTNNDTVDMIVRKSFFGNELDGLEIDDYK